MLSGTRLPPIYLPHQYARRERSKIKEAKRQDKASRIADLEKRIRAINDFIYDRTIKHPLPPVDERREKPMSKEDLKKIASDLGKELRQLKADK